MIWRSACVLLLAAVAIYKSHSKRKPDRSAASSAAAAPPESAGAHSNKNTNTSSAARHLPQEVIELILSKCNDFKSVVRCKTVCKSWRSIISDSRLIRKPRFKLPEDSNKFYVWAKPRKKNRKPNLYLITSEKYGIFERQRTAYPHKMRVIPLSSCDGLILLGPETGKSRSPEAYYYLWNPSINKCVKILPHYPVKILHDRLLLDPHLYYDDIEKGYKIVFVYGRCYYIVYSCKDTTSETKYLPRGLDLRDCDAIVDGCFYLVKDDVIVYFDCRFGKKGEFRKPNDVGSRRRVQLKEVSGRLCLYSLLKDGESFEVWVMEENVSFKKFWRKLMSLETAERPQNVRGLIPVRLSNEDDVVLLWAEMPPKTGGGFEHLIYNRNEKSLREIGSTWKYSDKYFRISFFSFYRWRTQLSHINTISRPYHWSDQ